MYSPFTHARAEKIGVSWYVSSDYWHFNAVDQKTAERICELLRAAYKAGREDFRGEMVSLLFPDMEDT